MFSAALCRGLIEAFARCRPESRGGASFPRLYAAASLKPYRHIYGDDWMDLFSAALCRGLIEAWPSTACASLRFSFSAALCRGLIEAPSRARRSAASSRCFPRLYAAASLKLRTLLTEQGLGDRFPRLYAAASLKPPFGG